MSGINNTFKQVTYDVTATLSTFYTVPAGTTAVVIGCQAANLTPNLATWITMTVDDNVNERHLVKEVTIPGKASLNPISGRLVLEAGHKLKIRAANVSEVSIILSVLERS